MQRSAFHGLFSKGAAVALLAGATAVQTLHALPPWWVDALLALTGISLSLLRAQWRLIGFALLGAGWTMWHADIALSQRLPANLEGADVVVTGTVRSLPRAQDDSTRFDLDIETAERDGTALPLAGALRLHWYQGEHNIIPDIAPCERWRLHVRLKRPRGLVDPGAFDFERYALSEADARCRAGPVVRRAHARPRARLRRRGALPVRIRPRRRRGRAGAARDGCRSA